MTVINLYPATFWNNKDTLSSERNTIMELWPYPLSSYIWILTELFIYLFLPR